MSDVADTQYIAVILLEKILETSKGFLSHGPGTESFEKLWRGHGIRFDGRPQQVTVGSPQLM